MSNDFSTHRVRKNLVIGIIGPTNSGKSTLINSIIGKKIAIVTHKVQTTRSQIKGILTSDCTQLVFIDTPGIFVPKRNIERYMVKSAMSTIRAADVIILMIDSTKGITNTVKSLVKKLSGLKVILVLNKIDSINKNKLLPIAQAANEMHDFIYTFMISALKSDGVDDVKYKLLNIANLGEWMYKEDEITDAPYSFLASEITREKIMLRVHKEIPYSLTVMTEFVENNNDILNIHQVVYVQKDSHKKIIIGSDGKVISKIRSSAEHEICETIGKKINLFLFVKVRSQWYDDPQARSSLSY